MIFEVRRTSMYGNNKKPCEEAFKGEVPQWHVRSVSEEEYNRRFAENEGGLWKERGTNHQITVDGYIKRQEGMRKIWCISLESLDDLIEFSKKYGDLIFSEENGIEIYDYYRE